MKSQQATEMDRFINCDVHPSERFAENHVEKHHKHGVVEFDAFMFEFILVYRQKGKRNIEGYELLKTLENKRARVVNACVLDHLLAHQDLIPESWRFDEKSHERNIFFWGTIYGDNFRSISYVRCMRWNGSEWIGGYIPLHCGLTDFCPALAFTH